jgi:UDP-2,3-diacylglucosamine hydrolase
MKAVFISDAHLKRATDERYGQLICFFKEIQDGNVRSLTDKDALGCEKTSIDDLYILGDFFDFWFCNAGRIHPEFQLLISKLVELQKAGIRIHLCEGNHDFFMTEYFRDRLGMEVFEEWADVRLDGLRMLVSHGDTADRSDKVYLMFRKILRSRVFYHVQRLIPDAIRWAIASMTSNVSKEMNNDNRDILVKRRIAFAVEKFHEGYDVMILGHCHKPFMKIFNVAGKEKTFVTLGDWVHHYSFLYYEDKKLFMSYYQPQ